jgi:uncharacterized protein (TIGR04141 family)
LSDQDQFGKIYNELMADLDDKILIKILKFAKEDIKKEKSTCLAKSSFKINKSISFDDLLNLIKQLTKLYTEVEPFFTLNKVKQITRKRHNADLIKALNDKLSENIFQAYTNGESFNIDFCNKLYESYFNASSYFLRFLDGETEDLKRMPTLSDIIQKIKNEKRLEDADAVDFKHSVLFVDLYTKDDQNIILTEGTVFQHIHGEIDFKNTNYFRVDGEWYQIDASFIKDLDKECAEMISRTWDTTLISKTFTKSGKEEDFNIQFVGIPGWLVFDKITPDNIEFCDILYYDKNNVYLVHVKKGFDNSFRDLAAQMAISAKRIRSDIRDKFHYVDKVEAATRRGSKSTDPYLKRMAAQTFPAGGLKSILKNMPEKNIVFCLAFLDTAPTQRSIKANLDKFRSNIAKYMLLDIHREIISLGFDFKIVQVQPHS